jgi:hypothetical protein
MRAKGTLHRRLAFLLFASIWVGPEWVSAATNVAAAEYGLHLTHRVVSQTRSANGIEIEITVTNGGTRDLSDLRIFMLRADGLDISSQKDPARIRTLPVGAQATLSCTFDTTRVRGLLSSQSLLVHIEAIDKATQEIVAFTQGSREGR